MALGTAVGETSPTASRLERRAAPKPVPSTHLRIPSYDI